MRAAILYGFFRKEKFHWLIIFSNFSIHTDIVHEIRFIPGQFDPFLLTKTHSMSHSICIPHQSQLVRKSTRTQVYSYTGQLAPMSHLSEVASKSSRTQVINLHPNQLVHKSTVTQVDSHPSQLAPKSHPSQLAPKSHTSQLAPK